MQDARLRELERAWRASGQDEVEEAAYLIERARVGAPYRLGELVTCTPALRRACEAAEAASAAGAPLLLVGEQGSGRATLARSIHDSGPRAQGPFVRQGSLRGETDFQARRILGSRAPGHAVEGLLARSQGGSALLTLYADLDPRVVSGLRRFVREGLVQPLGAREAPEAVDARLILRVEALSPEVADLIAGLPFVVVEVPPLRERAADLVFLLDALAEAILGSPPPRLEQGARELLAAHAWPGNGRELRFVLEACAGRAYALGREELSRLLAAWLEARAPWGDRS